jgi:hypothetical protein
MRGRPGIVGLHNRSLDLFPLCSYPDAAMWGESRRLTPVPIDGARKGLSLVRGMRRSLTDDEQLKVAAAIVEHLERSNWRIEQGPMPKGHGPHLMKDRTIERPR